MAYVTVPKDLTKVKSKVLFGLTKRQLACFSPAVLIGVPLFFLLKGSAGNSIAAFAMILVMLPFFLLAMYERNGQTLHALKDEEKEADGGIGLTCPAALLTEIYQ